MALRASITALCALSTALAGSITNCFDTEIGYTSSDGARWKICPSADYQGDTLFVAPSIKNHFDCSSVCAQYSGCTTAVFDKLNWACHIKDKSENLQWVSSAQYETIKLVSKPSKGDKLTSCPYGAYNVSAPDDSVWSICPNSDYQGDTTQASYGIATEAACADLCSRTTDCTKSVYEVKELACYLKSGKDLTWDYDPQYETARLLYKPQPGDAVSNCFTSQSNYTSSKGLGFTTCSNTDYIGDDTSSVDQVASDFDCILQCDGIVGCTKAVYDVNNKVCHIKAKNVQRVYSPGFNTILLTNGSSTYTGNRGKWAPPVKLPVVPAGAFIVPEQPYSYRILGYSSWGPFEFSGPTGITQFADYNWKTGAVSQRTVQETHHDMFCPGMSYLGNGTLVVQGGENAEATSFYNYNTNSWTRAADMKIPRGYQTSCTTSEGKIFTIGGSFTGGIGGQDAPWKEGEVYDPVRNQWTLLPKADVRPMLTTFDGEGPWRTDNHAWLYGWKKGYVFQAGPSKSMHWYGTTGQGSVADAGVRDAANDSMCGIHVMYDAVAGKIWSGGGSQSYGNSAAFTRAHLITIGEPPAAASVERLPDMKFPRGLANVVVLPSGEVLITGGQVTTLLFTDIQSIFAAELWDPVTKNYTIMRPAIKPRNYHSVSLLLADGTVWAAGGGLCPVGQGESTAFCDQAINHFDGEIFSPPYLFNADGTTATRPQIKALASDTDKQGYKVKIGGKLTVTLDTTTAATFALVRLGSATHSSNTDQRRVPIAQVQQSGAKWTLNLPADAGILIPGYYYLFAMNAAGTPCLARTVQVNL